MADMPGKCVCFLCIAGNGHHPSFVFKAISDGWLGRKMIDLKGISLEAVPVEKELGLAGVVDDDGFSNRFSTRCLYRGRVRLQASEGDGPE